LNKKFNIENFIVAKNVILIFALFVMTISKLSNKFILINKNFLIKIEEDIEIIIISKWIEKIIIPVNLYYFVFFEIK